MFKRIFQVWASDRERALLLREANAEIMVEGAISVMEENRQLRKQVEAKQAQIDALMLEHCPAEMTAEQLATWAAHQAPSPTEG